MAKKRKDCYLSFASGIFIFCHSYPRDCEASIAAVFVHSFVDMNILIELDSNNPERVNEIKTQLKAQFNAIKESWILNGMYNYYLTNNYSPRIVDLIVAAKEPHDEHFFNKCCEGIKSSDKLPHLKLLGHVVQKKPSWIVNISSHPLLKELLRLLKTETDIVTLVSALLIINILLPILRSFLVPHLQDIFSAFSQLAAVNANSNNYHEAQLVHLQISLYTLFHRLYGMFPCNFIAYLRNTYSRNQTPVFSHTVKPMLDTVRVNPMLILGSESWEIQTERWKSVEPHDILVSCAKLLIHGNAPPETNMPPCEMKNFFTLKDMLGNVKVTGQQSVADYCNELSKKSDDPVLRSPSARYFNSTRHIESTPTMIPVTPITRAYAVCSPHSEYEGSSPPEAAIEATPETTPIRDCAEVPPSVLISINRSSLDTYRDSSIFNPKVPKSDRSFPNSPTKKEGQPYRFSVPDISPKMIKLITDRQQALADDSHIELKHIGAVKNDLNNFHYDNSTISKENPSSCSLDPSNVVHYISEKQTNGSSSRLEDDKIKLDIDLNNGVMHIDSIDDFVDEQEKCGSPCSSGGLHMPDNRSMQNFVREISRMRHHSQCHSESDGVSTGTSPQDVPNYLKDAKVRRARSCPEIKKNSPSNVSAMTVMNRPTKPSVPEENDEEEEELIENSSTKTAACSTKSPILENKIVSNEPKLENSSKTEEIIGENVYSSSQTEDVPQFHFPYEHLFLDVFPPLHTMTSSDRISPTESENSLEEKVPSVYDKAYTPSKILQKYIDAAIQCHTDKNAPKSFSSAYDTKFLANQLKLMSIQLQFEEHRREMHAERNRRLFGRSRRNKTLEEHNNALKDEVLLLQQDLESRSNDMKKIEAKNQGEIEHERKAAEYWREEFMKLQQEYKTISDKFREVEAQLRDEKKCNSNNTKIIYETKAALTDITNELQTCQKEAKAAKELRRTVAEYQAEILKAGEMIARYRRRLSDFMKPTSDAEQSELIHKAYAEEVAKLKDLLSMQSVSLDATKALVIHLKSQLQDKENVIEALKITMKAVRESQKKELKELKEKYDEMKTMYNRETERSLDLDNKLNIAKRVNKLSNINRFGGSSIIPPEMKNIDSDVRKTSRRNSSFRDEGFSLRSNTTAHESEKLVEQKVKLQTEDKSESEKVLKELRKQQSIPGAENSYENTTAEAAAKITDNEAVMAGQSTNENNPDGNKVAVKKKGRMECAESGQLKPITAVLLENEPSGSGKKFFE